MIFHSSCTNLHSHKLCINIPSPQRLFNMWDCQAFSLWAVRASLLNTFDLIPRGKPKRSKQLCVEGRKQEHSFPQGPGLSPTMLSPPWGRIEERYPGRRHPYIHTRCHLPPASTDGWLPSLSAVGDAGGKPSHQADLWSFWELSYWEPFVRRSL